MEAATFKELEKINTMKLIITFFTTKLNKFIAETCVSDEDMLKLLCHLTSCVDDFISNAKVVETNQSIDSLTESLSCENVFACLACNAQTGNTYSSIVQHIDTERHITNIRFGSTLRNSSSNPSPSTGMCPVTMSHFPPNDDPDKKSNLEDLSMMSPSTNNSSLTNKISTTSPGRGPGTGRVPIAMSYFPPNDDPDKKSHPILQDHFMMPHSTWNSSPVIVTSPIAMPNFPPNNNGQMGRDLTIPDGEPLVPPLPYNPYPLLPIHLSNFLQQHQPLVPPPLFTFLQPVGLPMSPVHGNSIPNFASNNNTSHLLPMNGLQCNEVLNFGSNNNAHVNGSTNIWEQVPPPQTTDFHVTKICKPDPSDAQPKKRRKRKKPKGKGNSEDKVEVEFLSSAAQTFLQQNFELEVITHIENAKTLTDEFLYDDIIDNLIACCEEMNLIATIKCFGSRIIGVGGHESDVDLNISVNDFSLTADDFLKQLEKVLSLKASWTNVLYVRSRVSLVRARFNNELDCDISFNNDLSMANTKLTKYFYRIQPECHKLAVFIRLLAKKAKLYPYINMYTLNLFVFFYFQDVGYLPKVSALIDTPPTKYWPTDFTEKSFDELDIKVNEEAFMDLCIGFIDFYANHVDFDGDILSVYTGRSIPKSLFGTNEMKETSDCYNGFFQYMEDDPAAEEAIRTSFNMPICVQDPFAHDHNVARCLGKTIRKQFRTFCIETRDVLLKHPNSALDISSVITTIADLENSEFLEKSLMMNKESGLANGSERKALEDYSALTNNSSLKDNSHLENSLTKENRSTEDMDKESVSENFSGVENAMTVGNHSFLENKPASENKLVIESHGSPLE